MRRRRFFTKAGTIVAGALTAPQLLRASVQRFDWRMVMVIPKGLPVWGTGVQRFAEQVAAMTDHRLNIKVFGAGELIPALQTFDACQAGLVEMAHSSAYYWIGKLPAAAYFTAVPFGMDALGMKAWLVAGGGQQLWDELYGNHGLLAIPAGNTGVQMGGWFNRKINTADDFRGLKMRIPGLGGAVIEKLGAKPILVAGGEIYTNLTTGVIDAAEWVGPHHDYLLGLHKAARYYYYPGWHEPGPVLELMINKRAWQGLPPAYQAIVKAAAASLDNDMLSEWAALDALSFAKIQNETKAEILPFPKEVLDVLKVKAGEVRQQVSQTSPLAAKIAASFDAFQHQYERHQDVALGAYLRAREGS
jgi:TRAP-type mannitol/chloroaromatic compound transport system substrate-binding protein